MTTYALCIGIDEYERPLSRLRCARKDAEDLARVLREALGFDAQSLKPSAGRDKLATEDVFDALDSIGARLRPGDSFVLSFSGHGAVEGDEQYFFLSGARRHLVRAGKVAGPGVLPWSDLREHTAQEPWRGVQRIFILDACREPLTPSKRLAEPAAARFDGRVLLARNLVPGRKQDRLQAQKPDEPPHTVLHACSDGQLAFELPDGHNSVFTAALMQTLEQRSGQAWRIDQDYLDELRQRVEKVRAEAGLSGDEFVQAPAWNDVPARVAPPVAAGSVGGTAAITAAGPSELDARLWRLACAKNTVAGYEDYIRHAPPGAQHVDDAAELIEELLAQEEEVTKFVRKNLTDGESDPTDTAADRFKKTLDARPWSVVACIRRTGAFWLCLLIPSTSFRLMPFFAWDRTGNYGLFSASLIDHAQWFGLFSVLLFPLVVAPALAMWFGWRGSARLFTVAQVVVSCWFSYFVYMGITVPFGSSDQKTVVEVLGVAFLLGALIPIPLWRQEARKWFADVAAARRMVKAEAARQKPADST